MQPTDTSPVAPAARTPRRWLGTTIALLLLAALAGLAWHLTHRPAEGGGPGAMRAGGGPGGPGAGGPGGGRGRGGPPTTVGTAVAQSADIPVWIEALGTVAPAASVTVKPQVSGVLQQVLYKEGQVVRKGEPLATIDPRPFDIALMQAQGQRQRDEAQLDNARLTLERYRTLLKQDSIARQDVDTQAALVKQLEGTLLVDKAAEGTARLNLGYTRITAPVAGRVGLRTVDPGNLVSTGDANGVATIAQMTPIDVVFAIPQERVPEVQQRLADGGAMPVTALDRTRSQALAEGRFLTIDNQIDPQTGTVKAKARFTNEQARLFPNQFVNVRLLLNEVKGAVTVPISAVRTGPNGDYVFVLQPDHTVEQRPVQRGIATTDRVQIASGVKLGETVVTEGADRLRDGGRVMLPGDRPASGAAWGGPRGASWPHRGASGPWGGASRGGWRHRDEGASGNSGAGNPAAGQ